MIMQMDNTLINSEIMTLVQKQQIKGNMFWLFYQGKSIITIYLPKEAMDYFYLIWLHLLVFVSLLLVIIPKFKVLSHFSNTSHFTMGMRQWMSRLSSSLNLLPQKNKIRVVFFKSHTSSYSLLLYALHWVQ